MLLSLHLFQRLLLLAVLFDSGAAMNSCLLSLLVVLTSGHRTPLANSKHLLTELDRFNLVAYDLQHPYLRLACVVINSMLKTRYGIF